MRIFDLKIGSERKMLKPIVACIGYFDGMHKGHQALIKETVKLAKENNCETAMICFEPDPWVVIKDLKDIKHIFTMRERINLSVSFGIQNIIILHFTKEMSELSSKQFINLIESQLNLKGIVCGFDFHYGYHGEGNIDTLKNEVDYKVVVVDAVEDEKGKISSTRISQAIINGNFKEVNKMLGFDYCITGYVIHGSHKGTSIGFPTANIKYDKEYLLPKPGVYAGFVEIHNKKHPAMINLGHNPTFNYKDELSLEAHIFDFNEDIYNQNIKIFFIEFIREERKFKSFNNLRMQLDQDSRQIKKLLENYES